MQPELDPHAAPAHYTSARDPADFAGTAALDARFAWSHPLHAISLGFGSGLAPALPGATGTLLGWASFLILNRWLSPLAWGILIAVGFLIGLVATEFTTRRMQRLLPDGTATHAIVWDHIVAFWLVLLMVTPSSFSGQLAAFCLFRFFDTVKLPPVRYYQRKLKGGARIMVDDAVAAFLTLIVFALWRSH